MECTCAQCIQQRYTDWEKKTKKYIYKNLPLFVCNMGIYIVFTYVYGYSQKFFKKKPILGLLEKMALKIYTLIAYLGTNEGPKSKHQVGYPWKFFMIIFCAIYGEGKAGWQGWQASSVFEDFLEDLGSFVHKIPN